MQPHSSSDTVRVGRTQRIDMEIDRRPPLRERQGIAEDVGNLAARPLDPPARDEPVLMDHSGGEIVLPSVSMNVMSLKAPS